MQKKRNNPDMRLSYLNKSLIQTNKQANISQENQQKEKLRFEIHLYIFCDF